MRYSATKHHSDIRHCILLKLQCIEEGFWLLHNIAQIVLIRQNYCEDDDIVFLPFITTRWILNLKVCLFIFDETKLHFPWLSKFYLCCVVVKLRFTFPASTSRRYSIFNWNTDHNHSEALLSTGVPHYRLCYSPIFQLQNYSCSAVLWNHSHLGNCQNVIKIFVVNSLSLQVQPH